jgi:hypothetical protein
MAKLRELAGGRVDLVAEEAGLRLGAGEGCYGEADRQG